MKTIVLREKLKLYLQNYAIKTEVKGFIHNNHFKIKFA